MHQATSAPTVLRRRDRGYAAVLSALVIVPLLGFAGLAVDVGAWYSRASSLQRAADAASLAGVVWMPDPGRAVAEATAAAARNGFVDGVDGITITVTPLAGSRLRVEIADGDADLYFAGLFLDQVEISRQATAEYAGPVPLGSPRNHFGTDDLLAGAARENFHAAVNGSCTPREQGDHRSVHFQNSWDPAGGQDNMLCPTAGGGPGPDVGAAGNTTWNPNPSWAGQLSYTYYIDVPAGLGVPVDVYLRDPNFDPAGPVDPSGGTITTIFRMRAPDLTALDDTDNPVFNGCLSGRAGSGAIPGGFAYPSGTATGSTSLVAGDGATWDLFCRIPSGSPGRYLLDVGTVDFEPDSRGSNNYAVLARPQGGPLTCDTRVSATCPAVVAREWMSIYAAGPNATSSFYLAEIGDEHQGKRMRITLFDPGEGSNTLRILDPAGAPTSFTWTTADGAFAGSGTSLDVSQTCACYRPPGNASTSQFSDRFVEILIDLPLDFATAYGVPNRWWQVEYVAGGSPTDRTSWSVQIIGDPIRLVE